MLKTPNQLGPARIVHQLTGNPLVDQMLRTLIRAVEELQKAGGLVHENVVLADDSETVIAHGLGKAPVFVYVSPVRNAVTSGRITETRSSSLDRERYVSIGAYGWGADVIADIWFIG